MKYLLIIVCLFITGCGITNDEIIAKVKKCEDNGLKAMPLHDPGYNVQKVICQTPDIYEKIMKE